MELKIWQIACADLVILNKCDLVGPAEVARIKAWLDDRLHRYRLIETEFCDVPLEVLLGVGTFSPDQLLSRPVGSDGLCVEPTSSGDHGGDHSHRFESWTYETDRVLSLELLRKAAASLPATVYRAKGLVVAHEYSGQKGLLHVVGKRVDISPGVEWGDDVPRTRIVAIGAAGALENDALAAHFDKAVIAGD